MAEIEEKCSGDYLLDMNYFKPKIEEIGLRVGQIVRHLNDLAPQKYTALIEAYEAIQMNMATALERRLEIPHSDFVIPLDKVRGDMNLIAGGKMAHAGEMKNLLKLPVPDGFVITSSAFKRFMDHHGFLNKISALLVKLNLRNVKELEQVGREVREMIISAELPPEITVSITDACSNLFQHLESHDTVSVRSSALSEDGDFSFAGQYSSFLNVRPENVLRKYKEVVASLFTPRALIYAATKGFSEEDLVMAVGVMRMIQARSGGVLYSQDPNSHDRDTMIITGTWGYTQSVVDGTAKTDRFLISRQNREVIGQTIAGKKEMVTMAENGGVRQIEVDIQDRFSPCLNDVQIAELVRYAVILENHFHKPQDIEWSTDMNGMVYLLQARPLRVFDPPEAKALPRRLSTHPLLIEKGVIASKGIGFGKVHFVKNDEDLASFPEGGVLVSRTTSTKFAAVIDKASAIITDIGGVTGHMASLAREYRVPAILDTDIATRMLQQGQEVTVDAINCNVYAGRAEELFRYSLPKKEKIRETILFQTINRVMKYIVPLHLVDPEDPGFRPEGCTSFHDITRFSHEQAMAEMFGMSDTDAMEGEHTITLNAGIPIDAHMIDVGGGVRAALDQATAGDIFSVPFAALLQGLMSMKWPEPRSADVKGFLAMMAHAASVPEEQLQQTAIRSFAIVSEHYMNFSIRLGYHFQMIEAFAGDTLNDNYIKFFFKGGGAARDRRLRRVRLISEILRIMDFKVKVVEDVIDAVLLKFKRTSIEQRLKAMGSLTVYTKQLDMAMYNDDITDWYRDEFVRDYLKDLA